MAQRSPGRGRPFRVTFTARVVESVRGTWSPLGEPMSDPGVAFDFVRYLEPTHGPTVVRATAVGGTEGQRGLIDGDWLCDDAPGAFGQNEPIRERPERWGRTTLARKWYTGHRAIDAWEDAYGGALLLHVAGWHDRLHRQVVTAAYSCAGEVRHVLPRGADAEVAAFDATAAWMRGEVEARDVDDLARAARAVSERRYARQGSVTDRVAARTRAARAFAYAASSVNGGESGIDASYYASGAADDAALALYLYTKNLEIDEANERMASAVRRIIPTIDYLRALVADAR